MADGYLSFDTKINTEGFDEDIDKVEEKTKRIPPVNVEVKVHADDVDQAVTDVSHAEEKINEILNDTESSAKSKAMAIAAVYKKQGYTQQEALKKAWEQIEHSSSTTQEKIKKSSKSTAKAVKLNWSAAADGIKRTFDFSSGKLKSNLAYLSSVLGKLAVAAGAVFSVRAISSYMKSAKEAWNVQLEAESKLENILGRNLGATRDQIKATKEWASALQEVGVIGDEVQLSGLQELSTYIENADSLKQMNVVLNDMLAQQYGLNATAENAVTISTMLGKVLEGQTSALSRYGYSFTDAQEKLLKYGTEEQRVATLAEVVEASVGGMNEALARTPAGRLKQLSNTMGDIKEQFGQAFTNVQAMFIPALNNLANILAKIAELSVQVSCSLANIFGIETDNSAAVAANIGDSISAQNDLTDAVEETAKAQESLAGFDKINTISSGEDKDEPAENSAVTTITPVVSEDDVEKAIDSLTEKLRKYIEPIKLAWDVNSPQLMENAKAALDSIKGLFSAIAVSFGEVWTNGSGERFVGNLLILLGDVLGIVGDIGDAAKTAWEDGGRGTALVQSYADAWNGLLELIHSVAGAFRTVWNGGVGAEIFGTVYDILTNIGNAAAGLADAFRKAWEENDSGARIIQSILGMVSNLLGAVGKITGAAEDWAKNADFSPLLDSVAKVAEAFEPITEAIGDGLAWLYENVLIPLADWTITDYLPVWLRGVSTAFRLLNSAIQVLKPIFQWLWDSCLQPLAKFVGSAFITVLSSWIDILEEFADIVESGVPEAQELIGAFLSYVSERFQTAWDTIVTIWNAVVPWFTEIWNGIAEIFTPVAEWLGERFQTAWDNIVTVWNIVTAWFSDVWDGITAIFQPVADWFMERFETAWKNIVTVWSVVKKWFSDLWNAIKKVFSVVGAWFREQFQKAWNNIIAVWSVVTGWFSDVWDSITAIFQPVADWFKEQFETAWSNITDAFSNVKTWFTERWNDIKEIFAGVGSWFSERFQAAYDNVTRIFNGLKDFFFRLWIDISDGAKDGVNWIIGKLNDLLWAVETGLNWITDSLNDLLTFDIDIGFGEQHFGLDLSHISIPEIPYLAKGTVIPANYGNFLAMLGDNKRETEVVSPLSTIERAVQNALGKSGGMPKEIVVYTYLFPGSTAFHREVIKITDEESRRRGG